MYITSTLRLWFIGTFIMAGAARFAHESPHMQIILPNGYLEAVYEEMRAEGAACIADEVR